MRESVIYQDILQQGKQQGKQEEALSLVLRLVSRRFGEVDSSLREQVRVLSVEQLESLAEALFNMSELTDLVAWLSANSERN